MDICQQFIWSTGCQTIFTIYNGFQIMTLVVVIFMMWMKKELFTSTLHHILPAFPAAQVEEWAPGWSNSVDKDVRGGIVVAGKFVSENILVVDFHANEQGLGEKDANANCC
eukprot:TRINITY_DN33965_c0_g1_i1.p2 TRINITY_DN33965_c0_g1~~TRINITY_DN33965_c0_g1_i1.p2  ORF type:complete len:111 (-),score=9.66 TRINITY_DN33965_c0_g1_i1:55-387(-)